MQETQKSEPCIPDIFRGNSAESEVSREFLQERVAFFAKVVFLLSFGFFVLGNLAQSLVKGWGLQVWTERPDWFHLAACAVLGAMWGLTVRGRRSAAVLRGIDLGGTVLACILYGLACLALGVPTSEYTMVLAVMTTLIARAVLVPYPAVQTMWVGILVSMDTIGISYIILTESHDQNPLLPREISLAYIVLWCAVTVVLSTVISRVLFGLRREVREARKLGQYTLEERLGSGGMGVVFKAKHALLRRPTAIKMMRCDLAGERNIARFEREVQLTSLLTHPNTIAIYDYGRTPDGLFYYAMEYLDGITLEQLVERDGPQSPGRTVHLLVQVCASLAEAHGIGLIHRDIKAANVILCERGWTHDVVKVVDFGLVKEISNLSGVTQSAVTTLAGTPHYLPPEAIRSPEAVDLRSDLYAVGVLGYYLLTGKHVFEARSFVEICSHHLHTPPVPPSARLEHPLPQDLERVILACLEKDPGRRPRDAAALREALRACECAEDWKEEDARAWWAEFRARRPGTAAPHLVSAPTATLVMGAPADAGTT